MDGWVGGWILMIFQQEDPSAEAAGLHGCHD